MDMDKIITFFSEYELVVYAGGIGVVLGVWSLWLRYRDVQERWARRLCLASDILNTAFVSITFLGMVTVSFELAIHLPDLARSADIKEPETVDLSDLTKGQTGNRKEIETLQQLIQELPAQLQTRDLYATIEHLTDSRTLDKNSLANAVEDALGPISGYDLVRLEGHVPESQDYPSWARYYCAKYDDGGIRCVFGD